MIQINKHIGIQRARLYFFFSLIFIHNYTSIISSVLKKKLNKRDRGTSNTTIFFSLSLPFLQQIFFLTRSHTSFFFLSFLSFLFLFGITNIYKNEKIKELVLLEDIQTSGELCDVGKNISVWNLHGAICVTAGSRYRVAIDIRILQVIIISI